MVLHYFDYVGEMVSVVGRVGLTQHLTLYSYQGVMCDIPK